MTLYANLADGIKTMSMTRFHSIIIKINLAETDSMSCHMNTENTQCRKMAHSNCYYSQLKNTQLGFQCTFPTRSIQWAEKGQTVLIVMSQICPFTWSKTTPRFFILPPSFVKICSMIDFIVPLNTCNANIRESKTQHTLTLK